MGRIRCDGCGAEADSDGAVLYCTKCYATIRKQVEELQAALDEAKAEVGGKIGIIKASRANVEVLLAKLTAANERIALLEGLAQDRLARWWCPVNARQWARNVKGAMGGEIK